MPIEKLAELVQMVKEEGWPAHWLSEALEMLGPAPLDETDKPPA